MPDLSKLKLKVCGLRDNVDQVIALKPDFAGFIFYEKSPRYVGKSFNPEVLHTIPETTKKVGVFVNADLDHMLNTIKEFKLDYVQLHGYEEVETCGALKESGVGVIKVFSGNNTLSHDELLLYGSVIDYYLFDTRSEYFGGNGKTFNWRKLEALLLKKPVILSGGISLENIDEVKELSDRAVFGIDVNSKFEIEPGLKDVNLIKKLNSKLVRSVIEVNN